MKYAHSLLPSFLVALPLVVDALIWNGPQPTPSELASLELHNGFSPKPTPGPGLQMAQIKLTAGKGNAKREVIPENYCGFESGLKAGPVTCSFGRTCYFYTTPGAWGMRGCCTASDFLNCGWAIDCVNSAEYSASCGSACQSDAFTLKCTDPLKPYCQSYKYTKPGVLDFGCGIVPDSTFNLVETTYLGQDVGSITFNFAKLTLSQSNTFSLDGASASASESNAAASSTDLSFPTFTTTRKKNKKTSVGAIVGGVVGGLALIGLAIAGALFFCLRSRSNRRKAQVAVPQAGTQYAPGQGPGGYAPVQQQQQPSPQPLPMPMQQTAYQSQQPQQSQGFYGPVDAKAASSPQAYEVSSPEQTYYQGDQMKQGQNLDRPFSAELDGHSSPVSPLPAYARTVGSPGMQHMAHQGPGSMHGTLHSPMNPDGIAPYEAPGAPYR